MNRTDRTMTIGSTATSVYIDGENRSVTYHSTKVVDVTREEIVLNTGGFFTQTTKTRMNQASNQWGLGYKVVQKNGGWYVEYRGERIEFKGDSLKLNRLKTPLTPVESERDIAKRMKSRI